MVTKINHERLKEARLRNGLTLEQAAEMLGKSASWLSELERGGSISNEVLHKIASNYSVPVGYFWGNIGLDEMQSLPEVRKPRLAEKTLRRVKVIARDRFEVITLLEKYEPEMVIELKLPAWQGILETASLVRQKLYHDLESLRSVAEILEELGVIVINLDSLVEPAKQTGSEEISPIESDQEFYVKSFVVRSRYVICLAGNENEISRREALAEELGIILLHNSGMAIESEVVKSFARNLLLPQIVLKGYYGKNGFISDDMIEFLRFVFGLSRRSILEHLLASNFVTESGFRYWISKLNRTPNSSQETYPCCEHNRYFLKLLSRAALGRNLSYARTQEMHAIFAI
jgi:transcriptional regulator with XRE-family HTH domain